LAWHISGQLIEACSCKSICPCVLGPAEPDQGWCSGALTFVVQQGQSEGVDLSGRKVVWLIDLPKDFASGNGTVRLYIDDAADSSQTRELEAIFTGKKGGPGAVLGSLVATWLSTERAEISITGGDNPAIAVGGAGHVKLQRIVNQAGRSATLTNAPVLGLIEIDTAELARSDGSRFASPQMRVWDGGGHGSVSPFSWTA
jgi:hypothetical protein